MCPLADSDAVELYLRSNPPSIKDGLLSVRVRYYFRINHP